jgi:hypothetical protein
MDQTDLVHRYAKFFSDNYSEDCDKVTWTTWIFVRVMIESVPNTNRCSESLPDGFAGCASRAQAEKKNERPSEQSQLQDRMFSAFSQKHDRAYIFRRNKQSTKQGLPCSS